MNITVLLVATVLIMFIYGLSIMIAFLIGAKVTQKAYENEEINLPNFNPIKAVEEHRARMETNREQEQINTMLENINNYRGDGLGQKEIK